MATLTVMFTTVDKNNLQYSDKLSDMIPKCVILATYGRMLSAVRPAPTPNSRKPGADTKADDSGPPVHKAASYHELAARASSNSRSVQFSPVKGALQLHRNVSDMS